MKVTLNINIFLCIILFIVTNQLDIYALIMIFALLHELAHMVCGCLMGLKADKFKIMPLGFAIEFKTNVNNYNKKIMKSNILAIKKIIIAIAGPLINLLIVLIGLMFKINENIIYSNLLIFIFNLIPIYPLDGGRILKNLFKLIFGNRKANIYIYNVSNITLILLAFASSILILLYKNIAIFVVMIVLLGMVIKENKKYNTYNRIYKMIDKEYKYL